MSSASQPRPGIGFVSLVGAGPGDPDLLTRRAVQRLEQADVVLYDALVDRSVLDLASRARRVFVGKRAGRPAVRQEFIHTFMIRSARRGHHVVRLKGGDPFVFGRGGEEAVALTHAGIPFEVVPGITSAVAAAALAGIPVTHRGIAAGFAVVSGHAEEAYRPILEGLSPQSVTVVVLMGLAQVERIAAVLIARGWNPLTPAAILLAASTATSAVVTSTLRGLEAGLEFPDDGAAGTIVIGEVVRLRTALGLGAAAESGGQAISRKGSI